MNLEGVAEIELTNVHTGEKERYVEKNLVTNALQYIADANINGSTITELITPLYGKGLGGILLFDENIEENPDIVVAPGNIECIGYAGGTAYAGVNERRGSKNVSETQRIDDGAKLVWDFATNQANGTIKCLSLTSSTGGACGLGTENGSEDYCTNLIENAYAEVAQNAKYDLEHEWTTEKQNNVITIKKYKRPNKKIMITCDYKNRGKAEIFTMDVSDNTKIKSEFQHDANNLYFFGTENVGNDTNVEIRTFNKKTHEVTKNEIILQNHKLEGWYPLLNNNFLYLWYSEYLYKINLDNPTDIVEVSNSLTEGYYEYCIIGNRIYTSRYIIDERDKVLKLKTNNFSYETKNYVYYQLDKHGLIYEDTRYPSKCYLYSTYIATINNLATPVIKTADKTMKITYTIREKAEA